MLLQVITRHVGADSVRDQFRREAIADGVDKVIFTGSSANGRDVLAVLDAHPAELVVAARRLLADPDAARAAGLVAREAALARHGLARFLADWDAVFAEAGDNVVGQHLSTRDHLGYVVTDATESLSSGSLQRLRDDEHCLWVRTG